MHCLDVVRYLFDVGVQKVHVVDRPEQVEHAKQHGLQTELQPKTVPAVIFSQYPYKQTQKSLPVVAFKVLLMFGGHVQQDTPSKQVQQLASHFEQVSIVISQYPIMQLQRQVEELNVRLLALLQEKQEDEFMQVWQV